jgi:hypothetical protein
MKFTYNWLRQYVDFTWSPQELAEKLTFVGIEVEDIVSLGGGVLQQVVVCQVLSSEKHPNADKLTVCRVNDGTGERQIVCGAHNYKVGDKVPLALPGVVAGLILGFAKAIGEFGATITFVANIPGQTQTIATAIYSATQDPAGAATTWRLTGIALAAVPLSAAWLLNGFWLGREQETMGAAQEPLSRMCV